MWHDLAHPGACAVVINFFAPWCHWCQRLEPTWEAATKEVHDKYPEYDGRIRFAKVCVHGSESGGGAGIWGGGGVPCWWPLGRADLKRPCSPTTLREPPSSLLQVDCTAEVELCRAHFIQGFPSIRVFRKGHDDIYIGGVSWHNGRGTGLVE